MKNKKHILFDLDGTLTDPGLGITKSVRYALKAFDIEVNSLEELYVFIGPPLMSSFQEYYHFSENDAKKAVEKYREYFSETGIFENVVYSGIKDLLKDLRASGKKLYLATSKPEVFARKILERFELLSYFSFVGGSILTGERSEKEEVIQYVTENIPDFSSDDAVMIGDRKYDILAAKACKIKSIGVAFGYGSLEELKKADADYIAETVEELRTLLLSR